MAKNIDKMTPVCVTVIIISIVLIGAVLWHWNKYGKVIEKFQDEEKKEEETAEPTETSEQPTTTTATPTTTSTTLPVTTEVATTTEVKETPKATCVQGGLLANYKDLSACVQTLWNTKCQRTISPTELSDIMGAFQGKLENNSVYPFNDLSGALGRISCEKASTLAYNMRLKDAGNDPTKIPKVRDPATDLGIKGDAKTSYYKKLESYKTMENFSDMTTVATETIFSSISKIPPFSLKESMQVHENRKDNSEYNVPQVTEKFVSSGLDHTVFVNNTKKDYSKQSPLTTFELL